MSTRLIIISLLLVLALPVIAQEEENPAIVDTTLTLDDGTLIRYRGTLMAIDQPAGESRNEALRDERVPLGYGWDTVTTWREGDLRPQPITAPGRVTTEFIDLYYSKYIPERPGLNMAEYMDYAYHIVKDNLGWTLDAPLELWIPHDAKEYAKTYGLSWWLPGDMWQGGIVLEPIAMITARGIALEVLTRLYVEWQIRERTGDRLPYWFIYGAGAMFGGEGWILKGQVDALVGVVEIECDQATMIRDLELFRDREMMLREAEVPGTHEAERNRCRIAFWRSYRLAEKIILNEGVSTFRNVIQALEDDGDLSFASAVLKVYGKDIEQLISDNEPW
ncbi:MAG: hypothetical protein GY835_04630 [bacterium]|nr:hypothetical protein [bacterium]